MWFSFSPSFLMPEISIAEKIVRPFLVYAFLLIAFRIFGKRELGQLTPFDFVVLLIISNVVQNAMIGNDNSLTGGIIGATTIFVTNLAVAYLTFRFPQLERLLESKPTVLIENGQILQKNLAKELLTEQELFRALRRNSIDPDTEMRTLKRVELEENGQITIVRQSDSGLKKRAAR
jgi:uncharacterized membrane protein YcaP (DUF421 family)